MPRTSSGSSGPGKSSDPQPHSRQIEGRSEPSGLLRTVDRRHPVHLLPQPPRLIPPVPGTVPGHHKILTISKTFTKTVCESPGFVHQIAFPTRFVCRTGDSHTVFWHRTFRATTNRQRAPGGRPLGQPPAPASCSRRRPYIPAAVPNTEACPFHQEAIFTK